MVNNSVIPLSITEESQVSLGNSEVGTQPSPDRSDYLLGVNEQQQQQQQQQSPFPSQSFVPPGETALALEEPAHKGAKRAPPPQPPKTKRKPRNKATVTLKAKGKVVPRHPRFSRPTISTTPEPDDGSEYEDVPTGPSWKRRRRQNNSSEDAAGQQASSKPTSTTVVADLQSKVEDSPSTSTIPVGNQNEHSQSSTTATPKIVKVGKTQDEFTLTQNKNGQWTCPHNGCSHTTEKSHDMVRHLTTLAHRRKEHVCKQCGSSFTRCDALKRHKADRCVGKRR